MNNIQKAFKLKGKRQGLRSFAGGGDFYAPDQYDNATLKAGVAPGIAGNPASDFEMKKDPFNELSPSNRPQNARTGYGQSTPVDRLVMDPQDAVSPAAPRRPMPLRAEVPDFPRRFEGGGEVKSKADLLLEEMSKKYGVSSAAPAPAPAAAPVPAPAPAAAPAPRGLLDRATDVFRGRAAQIDKAAGFNDGGDIEPFVDDKGYIHGKPGIDKVPGVIEETGEPVRVGNGERIVNQKQNEALKRLAAQTTGMHLDEFLEQSTGSPVGPKVKNGLRGAADGMDMLDPIDTSRIRPQNSSMTSKAVNAVKDAGSRAMGFGRGMLSPSPEMAIPETTTPANGGRYVGTAMRGGSRMPEGLRAAGRVLNNPITQAVGKYATPLAMTGAAVDAGNTSTEDFANRMGTTAGDSLGKDLAIRAAGTMADVGNKLTFGLADRVGNFLAGNGFDHSDAYPKETDAPRPTAAKAAQPAAATAPVDPTGGMHPSAAPADATQGTISAPRVGLRNTVSTPVGDVIASRGASGQLNVTNDPRATPTAAATADEAARAKEADRLTKDMARQTAVFDDLSLKSDLASNDPEDRVRANQRLGLRKIDSDQATANNKVAADMYGHNVALAGHQMDNATRVATLQNQQLQQNMERNNKLIEQLYPATIRGADGKEMTNPEHQDFVSRLSRTLGENKMHIGHLNTQDLSEFQTAYDAEKKGEPGAFMKFYNKWIDGHPYVEDFNPHRQVGRAAGKEGRTNALGRYRNANGALVWEPGVVGSQFLTGSYNRNVKDLIGE